MEAVADGRARARRVGERAGRSSREHSARVEIANERDLEIGRPRPDDRAVHRIGGADIAQAVVDARLNPATVVGNDGGGFDLQFGALFDQR